AGVAAGFGASTAFASGWPGLAGAAVALSSFSAGGAAPLRGASTGASRGARGAFGTAAGAGVFTVILGPGAAAAGRSVTLGLPRAGMSVMAVLATGKVVAAPVLTCASTLAWASALALASPCPRGSAAFLASAGLASAGLDSAGLAVGAVAAFGSAGLGAGAAAGGFASDAVGAGGADTTATGAVAIFSGATFNAARATGCERTKVSDGTTVTKRWLTIAFAVGFAAGSCRCARCQRSSSVFCWTWAERLMRL